MKNKYCPVPEDEHTKDGKVKTSVGEMPCKYCEVLERQRKDMERKTVGLLTVLMKKEPEIGK